MTVTTDRWGIPRIEGDDVLGLARAQGEEVARRRTWQVVLDGWRVRGTTAAHLGEASVGWDVFARRAMLEVTARQALENLDADTRAFVTAYVEGVNAGLADTTASELDRLGVRPEPWQPWMPLGIFALNHLLFSSFPSKLWRACAEDAVGAEVVALLDGEPVGTAASNSWVVGGELTAAGRPLLAGDPHRLFEAPNVYQQVHLVCPGVDVVGFTFPGVPGVQHFAHAGSVAWGITNAMADYQDLVEHPAGTDGVVRLHHEQVLVRDGDPVDVVVTGTDDGPMVAGHALRVPSIRRGDLGFGALLGLLRARTTADVLGAFAHWVEPVNHLLVADDTGAVHRSVVGLVPDRGDGSAAGRARRYPVSGATDPGWHGWVGLPGTEVAGDEVAVGANQWLPGFEVFGSDFAPAHRASRIATLLAGRTDLTAADMQAVAADVLRPAGVLDDLLAEVTDPDLRKAVDQATDRVMAAEAPGAAAYADIRAEVAAGLLALPALAPLVGLGVADPHVGPLLAPWFDPAPRVVAALDRLLAAGGLLQFDPVSLVTDAVRRSVEADRTASWPRRFTPEHALGDAAPAVPLGGDLDTVCTVGGPPGSTAAVRGSVARYVWDLADRSAGGWVVPLGADGDLAADHGTDQTDLWAAGRLVPLPPYTREDDA